MIKNRDNQAIDVKITVKDLADKYQNIGTWMTLVGVLVASTAVGAPVGAVMMGIGQAFSGTGIAMELLVDLVDEDDFDWGNHAMNIGSEYVPAKYEDFFPTKDMVTGVDNILIEFGAAGSDAWMDFLNNQK